MHNTLLLSAFIVFLSCVHSGLQASACKDVKYTTIDDPRRSTAYTKTTNLCDIGLIRDNVWYRFSSEAGGEMPTTTPNTDRCGTASPIWLRGPHPSVEEGVVNRTACTNVGYDNCLSKYSYAIKVRNCSGFYIYQLKEPKDCRSVYCAGSKLPNCTNAHPEDYCLENRPPYITMPKRLYAFENGEFKWVFNATDPEGYPLEYGYHPNTTINNVSISEGNDGTHNIIISRTKSGMIVLRVKDGADKTITSTHIIEIVAVPCSCQNGGQCISPLSEGRNRTGSQGTQKTNITVSTKRDDLSNYSCSCIKPYTGRFCKKSPCHNFPCFPGVKCMVTADDEYNCENCPSRFEGDGKKCKILTSEDTVIVKGEFTIVSGLIWQANLSNTTSLFYKQETAQIVTKIMEIYRDTKEFVHVVITGYSKAKGSVVVDFKIVFKKKLNYPLKLLKTHLAGNNGSLGSFKVYPHSVKEKKTSDSDGKDDNSYFGLHKSVFIVVMCLVSLLALTAIVVCAICIKKKNINIIILCTNFYNREIVPSSSNANGTTRPPKKNNQVMDLHSVAT
ncbi:onco -induced transcript 3 -like [Paramuricea clavata]|uniref:Onco -induced transcript 3 -like n=1 Tax=Paramuricea clavata TaxID=317549 RepID=A0A7D9E0N7_PARCT|nr:onco -induced transcript 3 -like [Paramuricea clavata]